jgi:gluconate 2-dehydrogenase gamma chain
MAEDRDDNGTPAETDVNLRRRRLLLAGAAGLAGTAGAAAIALHDGELGGPVQTIRGEMPWEPGTADSPPEATGTDYKYLKPAEAAFVEAAVGRLIPEDDVGPGAVQAGVPVFIDRQLAGTYGRGDHFYLGGPWAKGTPQQGYQLRFTPAQLYRASIEAIDKYVGAHFNGATFAKLKPEDQDAVLKGLDGNQITLDGGVDAKTFFEMLLQNTREGYLSDPIYGGNKDLGAWKMIGFPGAHYDYLEWVERHGERVPYPTVGFKGRPGWREVEK